VIPTNDHEKRIMHLKHNHGMKYKKINHRLDSALDLPSWKHGIIKARQKETYKKLGLWNKLKSMFKRENNDEIKED
jgi:hypothetical protein